MAEACFKAGFPIGFGCGSGSTDANQTWGATFGAFGADLVNAKGDITVESDNVMAVMEYAQKMIKFMPPDAVSWDDASNNRALISGKAAYIWNPPSAWAVAKRDAPDVAADCWTFPNPLGREGPYGAAPAVFLGHLVVRAEQGRGEGPHRASVAARAGRAARRAGRRLRHPAVPVDVRHEGLGRGRAAEGHDLQLPGAAVAWFGILHPGIVRAAGDRGADLEPLSGSGHGGQTDVRPDDQADDRLGQGRAGRLRPLSRLVASANH